MAPAKKTVDHSGPGIEVKSASGKRKSARIDFRDRNERPPKTTWDSFIKKFDESGGKLDYSPSSGKRFSKLVSR